MESHGRNVAIMGINVNIEVLNNIEKHTKGLQRLNILQWFDFSKLKINS